MTTPEINAWILFAFISAAFAWWVRVQDRYSNIDLCFPAVSRLADIGGKAWLC